MRYTCFSLLLLVCFPLLAQEIGGEAIDADAVQPWQLSGGESYAGLYHFGFSEGESDLLIIVDGDQMYAQLQQGSFSNDGSSWVMDYQNFSNVSLSDHFFFSDRSDGAFVSCSYGGQQQKGLRIDKPWSSLMTDASYEIGLWQVKAEDAMDGRFPQASLRSLDPQELAGMSKADLRIMRNEIFARYGHRFRAAGAMEAYFAQQDWYRAQHANGLAFLTELEKANIALIQQEEARR